MNLNIQKLFKSLKNLMTQYGSAKKIALGFAVGVFISITPTFGFHMILATIFSTIFRINRASAILGTWFNNPLTTPFIYYIDYKIGGYIINTGGGSFALKPLTIEHYISLGSSVMLPVFIGSIILGIPVAMICYIAVKLFLKKYKSVKTSVI